MYVDFIHCLKGTNLCKDCQLSRSFKKNVNPNGSVSWELLRKLLASMVWIHQGPSRILIKKQLYSIMVIGHKCVVLDFVDLVLQRSEDMGEDLLEKDQKKQVGSARGTTRQQKPHGKLTENLRIRSMLSATCIMIFFRKPAVDFQDLNVQAVFRLWGVFNACSLIWFRKETNFNYLIWPRLDSNSLSQASVWRSPVMPGGLFAMDREP